MLSKSLFITLPILNIIAVSVASKISISLTTEELGGDSTDSLGTRPLVVHIDKENDTPKLWEQLNHASNIIFADFPDVPEFVNAKEYENMKYATQEMADELFNVHSLSLDGVKQDEKFIEIETILQEIINDRDIETKASNEILGETIVNKQASIASGTPSTTSVLSTSYPDQLPPLLEHSQTYNSPHELSSAITASHEITLSPSSHYGLSTSAHKTSLASSSVSHISTSPSLGHKNMTSVSSNKKTSPEETKTLATTTWRVPGNHANVTVNHAYDNGSCFPMPTTFFIAGLLSALIFVNSY